MKRILVVVVLGVFLCVSCASFSPKAHSNFTSEEVHLGMSKDSFLTKFGKPYKQNFFYNEEGVYSEVFFYLENLWLGYDKAQEIKNIETVFLFENGKLISQEQIEHYDYNEVEMHQQISKKYRNAPKNED